jgi:hypothetical protein
MEYQPESNRQLYAQLLAECTREAAPAGRGISFVSKRLRGRQHWYMQLVVGSSKTQHYLGPDSEELRRQIDREKALEARAAPERESREKLAAMLIAGGAGSVSAAEARVLELVERAGVFLVGGTLVGSHAFAVYGNMLGVRWETESTRTQDIDLAADSSLKIGIDDAPADLHKALMEAGMGFFEIPALDYRQPSTLYTIRGRNLTVDLLTPMRGRASAKPIEIRALGAVAAPVRFIEYLLEQTVPAVVVARAGILVNVPAPARFALHKLVTAVRRPAAWQTRALKDLSQARQLLEVLVEDRPGDILLAAEAARGQQKKFQQQLRQGIRRLPEALAGRLRKSVES